MIFGFAIWSFLIAGSESISRLAPDETSSITVTWVGGIIFGFVVMVLGIFLGVACRRLIEIKNGGRESIDIMPFLFSNLKSTDLWISLLGSPLLYGSIIRTGAELSFGAFLYFALQSGFSAYVIITSLLSPQQNRS